MVDRRAVAVNAPTAIETLERPGLVDSRFTVPGMRCAGCIAKIERGLQKVDGVDAVRVNFSAKRVAVRHDRSLDAALRKADTRS